MRWVMAVGLVTLSGCSEGRSAEKRYRIVADTHDAAETCSAAKATADAYLRDNNEEAYKRWRTTAEQDCAMARLDALSVDHR